MNRTTAPQRAYRAVWLVLASGPAILYGAIAEAQLNVTIQLPTFGVAVDAEGVLSAKTFKDVDGRLQKKRIAAARAALPADILAKSDLRKVSLVRLERAIQARLDEGKPLTDDMQALAGLQRLQFIFCYPENGDVVLAGPAEGWAQDAAGRMTGLTTGRPVLELRDLLVALRAYRPGRRDRPFIGCTIDPTQEGLARLQQFQRTVPRTVSQRARGQVAQRIAVGTRDALGMSNIRVFGIPATTHFAHVLVEADHRMKRIGIGLEPPPVKMATFLGSLKTARNGTLQRWWFQPSYDCVKVTEDRMAMELVGQGVQLLAEDLAIGPGGNLINPTARVNQASRLFTQGFTKKYPEIAAASPVYAQMRNCIDMLIAAAYVQREDFYGTIGWRADTLLDEGALPTQTLPAPKQVEPNVNVVWKGNRLLSPAGGVSLQPEKALEADRVLRDEKGEVRASYKSVGQSMANERWWWD